MTAQPHCKRGCGRLVAKRGQVCPACRKTAPRRSNGYSPHATGGAERVLGLDRLPLVTHSTEPTTPTYFMTLTIMARYSRRYYGGSLTVLSDRAWTDLHHDCSLAADALNAWQARRNGSQSK